MHHFAMWADTSFNVDMTQLMSSPSHKHTEFKSGHSYSRQFYTTLANATKFAIGHGIGKGHSISAKPTHWRTWKPLVDSMTQTNRRSLYRTALACKCRKYCPDFKLRPGWRNELRQSEITWEGVDSQCKKSNSEQYHMTCPTHTTS